MRPNKKSKSCSLGQDPNLLNFQATHKDFQDTHKNGQLLQIGENLMNGMKAVGSFALCKLLIETVRKLLKAQVHSSHNHFWIDSYIVFLHHSIISCLICHWIENMPHFVNFVVTDDYALFTKSTKKVFNLNYLQQITFFFLTCKYFLIENPTKDHK